MIDWVGRACIHAYIHELTHKYNIHTHAHVHICVIFTQIVKRLKEERIGFDNQLAAIERTLKAKEKDLEELVRYYVYLHIF